MFKLQGFITYMINFDYAVGADIHLTVHVSGVLHKKTAFRLLL